MPGACLSVFIRLETNTTSFNSEAFVAGISRVQQITDSGLPLTPNKQGKCHSSTALLSPAAVISV